MADRIAPGQVGIFGLHIGSQMDAVVGDGARPHMGEGPDGVVGADLGGVDLAGIDGGAGADLAVLDEGVGPMTQSGPITVLPRRMVPGRILAPGAIWTVSSMQTVRLSIKTPLAMCRSRMASRAASAASRASRMAWWYLP